MQVYDSKGEKREKRRKAEVRVKEEERARYDAVESIMG